MAATPAAVNGGPNDTEARIAGRSNSSLERRSEARPPTRPTTSSTLRLCPGQRVCRQEFTITGQGIEMGPERGRDGRSLLAWQGCRALRQGEVFLMNWEEPASLDSR
jgi:hypothetical protein